MVVVRGESVGGGIDIAYIRQKQKNFRYNRRIGFLRVECRLKMSPIQNLNPDE